MRTESFSCDRCGSVIDGIVVVAHSSIGGHSFPKKDLCSECVNKFIADFRAFFKAHPEDGFPPERTR